MAGAGAVLALGAVPAAAVAASPCRPPAAGAEWKRASPESAGLDAAALDEAIALATALPGSTAAVYRHGCLVATDRGGASTRDRTYESWSVAKTAVSLAAGRAMTLGLLSPDDPVGSLVPEADRDHGALTVRQLLEMASGLHWNFIRDYNQSRNENRVNDALTLPFDHRPGAYFEYAQSTVALTAEVVERAAGTDFQTFVQRELFGPIGIARGSWTWLRERHGHTLGFMGLQLRPRDYARFGQLMLQGGIWNGRRVVAADYVDAATTPSRANAGYGWFWWVNEGARFIGPTIEGRADYGHRFVESAPPDMFSAVGFGDQLVMVFPALDMVLTRSAASQPGAGSPTGQPELKHEVVRGLMRAVRDDPVRDSGPYVGTGPLTPRDPAYGIRGSAAEAQHVAAAVETPSLPPRGPAVARAVQIGGSAVHASALRIRAASDGRLQVTLACPRTGRRSCEGTLSLARGRTRLAPARSFRIARGKSVRVTLTLAEAARRRLVDGRAESGVLRASARAAAGPTVSEADVRLTARR